MTHYLINQSSPVIGWDASWLVEADDLVSAITKKRDALVELHGEEDGAPMIEHSYTQVYAADTLEGLHLLTPFDEADYDDELSPGVRYAGA